MPAGMDRAIRSNPGTAALAECFVEHAVGFFEVNALDKLAGLGGAGLAVHHGILPLHRKRAGIADRIQAADDFL